MRPGSWVSDLILPSGHRSVTVIRWLKLDFDGLSAIFFRRYWTKMELNLLKTKDYLFITEIEKQGLSRCEILTTNQGIVGSIPASRTI